VVVENLGAESAFGTAEVQLVIHRGKS
jgi:hypothetical protein